MKNRSLQILKRTIIAGFIGFYRNKSVSISSITILITTLMIIGTLFFFRGIFNYTLSEVKNKLDIKVYFKTNSSLSDIENVKDKILALSQVKSIIFISAEESLNNFRAKHINDAITLSALDHVASNPFGASLTILAQNPTDYEVIARNLESDATFLGNSGNAIDKLNYFDIKNSLDKLNNIIGFINIIGFWITIFFAFMSSMIIYNTTRLAIFVFKDEISVMKLVGASNMFIRGPFVIQSIIYALISSTVVMLIFSPVSYYLATRTNMFFSNLDIHSYYLYNFFTLFGLLLISSLFLSVMSSLIAIRNYLNV